VAASIAQGLEELHQAEKLVDKIEAELKAANERVRLLQEVELPRLFDEAEEFEVALPNGLKGKRTLIVHGTLPKVDEKADFETQDKQRAARKAAIEAAVGLGWGPLIKCTVSSQFDKGDAEKARRLYEELRGDNSAKVDLKEDIHPQTLFAQVRRAVEEGKRVPLETLGVNVISGVKLTKRPKEQI